MRRYYVDTDWTAKKLSVRVPAPEQLDLTPLRGSGLQPGETPLPEEEEAAADEATPTASWYYCDLADDVHGPFAADLLEDWDSEGFLPDELRITAVRGDSLPSPSETVWVGLATLKEAAQGKWSPFSEEALAAAMEALLAA